MTVTGATDGDAGRADGEELQALTKDSDRKQVRLVRSCVSLVQRNILSVA